jgi:cell division protease FtsH
MPAVVGGRIPVNISHENPPWSYNLSGERKSLMTRSLVWQMVIVLAAVLMINYVLTTLNPQTQEPVVDVSYSRFKTELEADNVAEITFEGNKLVGSLKQRAALERVEDTEKVQTFQRFRTTLPPVSDTGLLDDLQQRKVDVNVIPEKEPSPWATALIYLLPWILIIGVWWFIIKGMRSRQGPGGGVMGGFSKSGAKMYTKERSRVTFADVAGLDEAKQELMEIIEFLRNPKRFLRLGAKAPRGVLLVGPPGTGKTLMARAVAGEAGVPFFTISASQFIEMFVGVGASRVRDLFNNAKKNAPSIIFIDELDAVGRSRGTGLGGGNDEREQTLNQLLSEMDGFEAHDEVIVMSATNRPDVLDPALLRPGRFDRQVTVERPDWRARGEILKVHTRHVPIADDVDLQLIARSTPGMCGADLENLVNEAAMIAARENAQTVSMDHFERAKDRVLMGTERKIVMSQQEKRITAYHEAGHTLLARLLPGADPIHKVSIIPRGQALGVTQQLPVDDRYHYSRSYLMTRIAVSLGGRAAEKAIFEEYSTGAQNDLKQVTDLAEKMVCQWGMSERVGPMSINRGEEHPFLGRKLASDNSFSEHMAWIIDQEIEKVVKTGEQQADEIIGNNLPALKKLAEVLLEEEVLDNKRVDEVLRESGVEIKDSPVNSEPQPEGDDVPQGELAGGVAKT